MRFHSAKLMLAGLLLIMLMAAPVFLTASPSWAQEERVEIGEVVVTASRVAEPAFEAINSVVVITAEDLQKSGAEFLPDALRSVPGINVIQSGGAGKLADVYLRGASSKHTVILIDGVKVNDPLNGGFDFSRLSVDDIERVEIVKGPQSTMYGSDALAGVINIITKKGRPGLNIGASFEGGSFGTYKPMLEISGGWKPLDYRLTGSYFKTDGISQAASGTEDDGYENASFSGKLGYAVAKNASVELNGRYSTDKNEQDGWDYSINQLADDLNYTQDGRHYVVSGKGQVYLREDWEQILTVSTVKDDTKNEDPDTANNNFEMETGTETVDWQSNVYSGPNVLTVGAEYRVESGKISDSAGVVFDESVDNKAAYASTKVKREDLTLSAGVRYDSHETAGEKTTWRVGASEYRKDSGLTVRASYGTGFRAPGLNDLFYKDAWGSVGNPGLKPEESTSWEVGMEKEFSSVALALTYFDQNYKDLIEWTSPAPGAWQPQNVNEATIRGVETGLSYRLTDALRLKADYTYLDTENKLTGERLQRRPQDKAGVGAAYSGESLSLSADALYVGERFDAAVQRDLDSYYTVNLGGGFKLTENFSLTARVENLLDDKHEEAGGYGTPGRAFYGGVKATF